MKLDASRTIQECAHMVFVYSFLPHCALIWH